MRRAPEDDHAVAQGLDVRCSNPIGAQWVSDLTAPQTNEFRQTLDAMLRERSGGRPGAVLHTELTVGTRRRP